MCDPYNNIAPLETYACLKNAFMHMRLVHVPKSYELAQMAWMKVFMVNPEFRILRPTFHKKWASKS